LCVIASTFSMQGGGMQGIISAAGLVQLANLGLRGTFDAVYGASAGAINAAYFLSGQNQGIDVYTEHLCCGRFLDLTELLPPALKNWNLYLTNSALYGNKKSQAKETQGGHDDGSLNSDRSRNVGGNIVGDGANVESSDSASEASDPQIVGLSSTPGLEPRSAQVTSHSLSSSSTASSYTAAAPPIPKRKPGRPAMDLDFLLHEVMTHHIPLDWNAVINSPIPLKVRADDHIYLSLPPTAFGRLSPLSRVCVPMHHSPPHCITR